MKATRAARQAAGLRQAAQAIAAGQAAGYGLTQSLQNHG